MICEVCKSDNPYTEFCEECLYRYLEMEDQELLKFQKECEEE